jgi:23S rRNA pseudouridine1911/1915/1917 synthase
MDENIDIEDGQEEMYERLSIKVDKGQEPLRIDKFLQNRIENATRNKIQKAIDVGHVLVNEKLVRSSLIPIPIRRVMTSFRKRCPSI